MNIPSSTALRDIWERGASQSRVVRALLLLMAVCPDETFDGLAQHSIGERDLRLLKLRERLFGTTLASVVPCPRCHAQLELTFETASVTAQAECAMGELAVDVDGYAVRFRLPNSNDLLALSHGMADDDGRAKLLARCVSEVHCDGERAEVSALPECVVTAIGQRMAVADPQADVHLALNCPTCGHAWLAGFDIAAYVWTEIDVWARRLLREVHALAGAYGWSEAEILRLSQARRRAYLELIGAR